MTERTNGRTRRAAILLTALLFLLFTACSLGGERSYKASLSVSAAEISAGGRFLFEQDEEGTLSWSSSDDAIASVENGMVTAVSEGYAVVSVSDGKTLNVCKVTVKKQPLGVKYTQTDANLAVGDFLTLSAGLPEGVRAEWASSDESVVTVEGGLVSAVGAGEAAVTVLYGEDLKSYTVTVIDPSGASRVLIWSDEFDGGALDETKWEFQTGVQDAYINQDNTAYGPWFWGNNELQYYTRDAVSVAEGALTITAARQSGLPNGRTFTSARISTRDRAFWTYGYFEARMRLPLGTGMWPAFWMLPQPEAGMGTQNRYGGWAANGEIDIMEAKGRLPMEVGNTLHYGGNPSVFRTRTANLGTPVSEWHVYGFEWRNDHMAWFVDGEETFRVSSGDWFTQSPLGKDNDAAPFDVPFYLLINLAVGGNYDGGKEPPASLTEATMDVDYVRVYA